ncbi:iron-sulfur cluster insertion protein ErpA [Flavobacteriaceae bacterium]|nr:iron-sulfur cluster insertion protein ErpA [Flavobacteriaceae bacterium]
MVEKNIGISLSDSAKDRILEIKKKSENQTKHLRITIMGGGCSGFSYNFSLDDKVIEDDFIIKNNEVILLAVDSASVGFIKNCVVDYVFELGGAFFKINNPDATATCGCGSSFSV